MTTSITQKIRGTDGSLFDILPETETAGLDNSTVEQMLARYGQRYIRYLEAALRVEQARQACTDAMLQFPQIQGESKNPLHRLAAYKCMKAKTCDELTTAALFECRKEGRYVIRVVLFNPQNLNENHGFLISTDQDGFERFKGLGGASLQLGQILAINPNAQIIDPYLNFECRACEFDRSPLKQYSDTLHLTKTTVELFVPGTPDEYQVVQQISDRIAAIASPNLGKCSNERIAGLKQRLIQAYRFKGYC